jgi:transcription initiation factor IIE alpha subunit
MKKTNVPYELIKYLESHPSGEWGGNLEDYIRAIMGSKGSTTSRDLRYMAADGRVVCEKRQVNGKGRWVNYYWLPVKQKVLPQFAREVVSA